MKATINIVIVTYNNKDLLESCLKSVEESLDRSGLKGQITVVDNASSDGTPELIGKRFPHVNHVKNKQNLGFAKALNVGIKKGIDSDYTLLLNDDVELFPQTIASMVDTLNNYPVAKGSPACLVYPDGRPQPVKLKILGAAKKSFKGVQIINFSGTTACMYRTEIFNIVGFFDEFYFFYNEDLDFSLRAKRKGMKSVFDPDIKVIHHRKKGRVNAVNAIKPYFYATDYYFYRKNFGLLFSSVYLLMAYIHILLWRRRFRKENESEKFRLLQEGIEKLRETRKNYKKLRNKSVVS